MGGGARRTVHLHHDNLVRISQNRNIRVMRHKDQLAFHLEPSDLFNESSEYEPVVQVVLRLIEHEGVIRLSKDEWQKGSCHLAARKLANWFGHITIVKRDLKTVVEDCSL